MYKKTITYEDFNGEKHTDDFYFNMSKAEIMELNFDAKNGNLEGWVKQLIKETNTKEIKDLFKKIILSSYGEKSLDGMRFIKSKEKAEEFSQTDAYSELFTELLSDTDKFVEFVNGIVPKSVSQQIQNQQHPAIPAPPEK